MSNQGNRIIVALDGGDLRSTTKLLHQIQTHVGYFQIGLEHITRIGGPQAVGIISDYGPVLFDGRFYDTPDIVRAAARNVSSNHVGMFTVHASMGTVGMKAAREGNEQGYTRIVTPQKSFSVPSKILAVTVLTSLSDEDSKQIFGASSKSKVLEFAHMALEAGLDGIICSPWELMIIGGDKELDCLIKVAAGIRSEWADRNDQIRVMTPAEAIKAGADYLVIGRPITEPGNGMTPLDAVRRINDEIAEALASM